ncbi:MAG: S-adenosyl-l-methionine hydroxide adenosyltransferase family protein [Chitinophagaceae bacterium]
MKKISIFIYSIWLSCLLHAQPGILVFQTDFGLQDGAVAAMKGVAMGVSPQLKIFDLTHEIPPYNIWAAAYRLEQTAAYWPKGTVFVSVVDPGVGSNRKSIVLKTKNGQYFVTPDNGTVSLIAASLGVEEVRIIDEKINRLKGSGNSNTFHGRDVFAYTGARLASGKMLFQQVGPLSNSALVRIIYQAPVLEKGSIKGIIPVLDVRYGNVWTNIPDSLLKKINMHYGDSLHVVIYKNEIKKFNAILPFVKTFADVPDQQYLAYVNSLMNLSVSINQGNFAAEHSIQSGPEWKIEVSKK